MPTLPKRKMRFVSHPYDETIEYVPMTVAVILGWSLVVLGFVAACFLIQYSRLYGSLMLFSVFALCTYLCYATCALRRERAQRAELIIENGFLVLSTFDGESGRRVFRKMDLSDVRMAEYHPSGHSATVTLRGEPYDMDIPLWAFGADAEHKIIDYLRDHDVEVESAPLKVII